MSTMLHLEAMEQEYVLACKILIGEISYNDEQSQGKLGNMIRKVVLFDPKESGEMYRFFSAWMGLPPEMTPQGLSKRVEILARIDHPFHQYCRFALMHPKSQDPESQLESHHFFLMSYGLSQMILAKPSLLNQEITITVMPASDDHPDGCPTDGEGEGDDLYVGTRKTVNTGLEIDTRTDRHGNPYKPLS